MSNQIFKKASEIKDYVANIRRHLHENPELGFKEINTTKLIKKELLSYGVELVDIGLESGVLGILKGKKEGPDTVTALRADIDALPIEEKTKLPYSSKNDGLMHACGHDGHTAMLLGTAKLLSTMTDEFSGTVKFIFQPAEELLSGAQKMVDAGVLENPKVDSIVALHAWPYLPTGVLGTWKNAYYASGDKFTAKIIGGSGHGAYPHKSNDSLLAATHAVVALQSVTSRQLNAIDNTVLSVCTINGGKAFNTIPEFVEFSGTVRCHNKDIRQVMPEKMEKIIKSVSEGFNCKYEFNYEVGCPGVENNPDTVDAIIEVVKQISGEEFTTQLPGPVMGSEDFGVYAEIVKDSAIFRLGTTDVGEEEIALHNERYNFNDDSIPYGISIFTQYILNKNN